MMAFNRALKEWTKIIGKRWITTNQDKLKLAENATFHTTQKICAILQPKTTAEVSACMIIANKHSIPVYPISGGKNWGYGSKVPVQSGSVLLDLTRMNKIVKFDENLAYVVIEPGVTQSQLLTFLNEKTQGRLWLDTVASSPHTSVIGNAMERGHGTTPYCDRIAQTSDYEVVLPSGEIINTGYGIFSHCKTQYLDPWGLGPAVTHLFSQSNFGIVTKISLFLYPAPESTKLFIFSTQKDIELIQFINWANQQRIRGILKAGPYISNDIVRLIRVLGNYPWKLMHDQAPLAEAIKVKLCSSQHIAKWSAVFGLWGETNEVLALQAYVEKHLHGLGKLTTYDEATLLQNSTSSPQMKDLLNTFQQMTGNITGFGLKRPYWRMQHKPYKNINDIDLDKDHCGYMSINICVPFVGKEALEVANLSTKIITKYGYEPNIAAYSTRPRTLQFHLSICYDRKTINQDQQVLACQAALIKALETKGYYSSRLNIASMQQFYKADAAYLKLIKGIKLTLDPNNILSPGRYCPLITGKDKHE